MTRRFALILVALMATASVVLAACGAQTPAAPALTDPKEILTSSVLSLKDVKTLEFTSSFTGSLDMAELGSKFDLSTVKMNGALDIANGKAKFTVDAPTLLGTKVDALLVDNAFYYKIAGPLAMFVGGSADKYTKVDVPEASGKPVTDVAELAKADRRVQGRSRQAPDAADQGSGREVRRPGLLPRLSEDVRRGPQGP